MYKGYDFNQKLAVKMSLCSMIIFDEPTYAWELLEWEIAIEMNESLMGKLLQNFSSFIL